MIVIVDWTKQNTARLTHLRKVRLGRGLDPMAPAVLDGYSASSSPSVQFLAFADSIGLRTAESFWHRIQEYCASKCAQTGEIRVPRDQFGRTVLSRGTDPVGQAHGERVYDALLAAGLAAALCDGTGSGRVPSQSASCAVTAPARVPSQSAPRDGTRPRLVTAQAPTCDGTEPPAVTAQPGLAHVRGRVTPAQRPRSGRVTGAHVVSRLEGAPCAVTSDAPDQTRPEKPSAAAVPEQPEPPTANGNGGGTVNGEQRAPVSIKRLEDELRFIEFDRGDGRRSDARALRARPERNSEWIRRVEILVALGRRSIVTVPAAIEPNVALA